MRKRGIIFSLLFFSLTGGIFVAPRKSYADITAPLIIHTPVTKARGGVDLTINLIVIDNEEVESVLLYYKGKDEEGYRSLIIKKDGFSYLATIPGEEVTSPEMKYYLEAKDKSGNTAYLPADNPTANPYCIEVEPPPEVSAPLPKPQKKFLGNWTTTLRNTQTVWENLPEVPPVDLLAVHPGFQHSYNLNLFGRTKSQSYTLWLNREIELYTNKTREKFRFNLYDQKTSITLGDFYGNFSELSLTDVEIRGGGIGFREPGKSFEAIVGRSHEPVEESVNATPSYAQYLLGMKKQSSPFKALNLSLNLVYCADDKDSISTPSTLKPIEDVIIGGEGVLKLNKDIEVSAEVSRNFHDEDTTDDKSATKDDAFKIKAQAELKNWKVKGAYREIGADFHTAGVYYMENDKRGPLFSLAYEEEEVLALSLDFERYYNNLDHQLDFTTTTTTGSANFSLTKERLPALSLKYSQLGRKTDEETPSTDLTSTTSGLGLGYSFEGSGDLGNTRFSSNYQIIDYKDEGSTKAKLKIKVGLLGLETAYRDIATFSSNLNLIQTKDLTNLTTTKKRVLNLGLTYIVIPFKFTTQVGYQFTKNTKTDGSIDDKEGSFNFQYNYNLRPTQAISLGIKWVTYKDRCDESNNYKNDLFTFKLSQSF